MAKLYNQQSVATNKATTAQTSSSFRYKGFSSNETKNNFSTCVYANVVKWFCATAFAIL